MRESVIIGADCPPEQLVTYQENNEIKRADHNGSRKENKFSVVRLRLDPEISSFLDIKPGDIFQLSELLILVDFAFLDTKARKLALWRKNKKMSGVI